MGRRGFKAMMKSFCLYLAVTVLLAQLCLPVSSNLICKQDEDRITLRVEASFMERSIAKDSSYSKSFQYSKSFKNALTDKSTSTKVTIGIPLFSASASAEFSKLTADVLRSDSTVEKENSATTTFNTDFLQIMRKVETTVSINDNFASSKEERFVDSVPESKQGNQKDLYKRADNFMKYTFGKRS